MLRKVIYFGIVFSIFGFIMTAHADNFAWYDVQKYIKQYQAQKTQTSQQTPTLATSDTLSN